MTRENLLGYNVTNKAALNVIKTLGQNSANDAFLLDVWLECDLFPPFSFYFDQVFDHLDWRAVRGGLPTEGRPSTAQSSRSSPNVAGFVMMGLRRHHSVVGCLIRAVACLSPDPPWHSPSSQEGYRVALRMETSEDAGRERMDALPHVAEAPRS